MKTVLMAMRIHLYPCRTQKLSSAEPKILAWRRAGTIGHCRHLARATVLAAKGNMGMHSDTPLVSLYFYSSLAQSVERVTVNHDVAGSSPAGGAIAGQQFCTLTQKSLIFKGFSCFLGSKTHHLHHYIFFPDLMVLNLQLYGNILK